MKIFGAWPMPSETSGASEPSNLTLVIIGGGGGAKVAYSIAAFISDRSTLPMYQVRFMDCHIEDWGDIMRSLDMGPTTDPENAALLRHPQVQYFVAIGDNAMRAQITRSLIRTTGHGAHPLISPDALCSPLAKMGVGNLVCAGAIIGPAARVGNGCIINHGATVDHDCAVEDFAQLCPGVHLGGYVTIGQGAFVGLGAVVLPHVKVGEWATVGAGAVVTEDVPAHATVAGVPAKALPKQMAGQVTGERA